MVVGVWIPCKAAKELPLKLTCQTKMVTFVSLGTFTQRSFGIQVPRACRQLGL